MNAHANTYAGALLPGTRLLDYQVERVLGVGGFGITYAARDPQLGKSVAIKEYLPAELCVRQNNSVVAVRSEQNRAAFAWGREQFIKEARLIARFNHPNLVHLYRYFEANDTAYFVMEYAEGTTLEDLLKRQGTLSEAAIKSILMPILDGLREVHRARILHRDIKPSNIIIRRDGVPVLIDFGSARQNVGSMTRSIMSVVTAGYAPLEQYAVDGHQGPWTDIYAAGAVAYRALSGKRPLDAVNRMRRDPLMPAVAAGAGRYTPHFLKAVDWAMMVNPEDRPVGIADWRQALEGSLLPPRRITTGTPMNAPPWPVSIDTPDAGDNGPQEPGEQPFEQTLRAGDVDYEQTLRAGEASYEQTLRAADIEFEKTLRTNDIEAHLARRAADSELTRVVSMQGASIPPARNGGGDPPVEPPSREYHEDDTPSTATHRRLDRISRRRQMVWGVIGLASVFGLVWLGATDPGRFGLDNTAQFTADKPGARHPLAPARRPPLAPVLSAPAGQRSVAAVASPVPQMPPLFNFRDCEDCPVMVVLPQGTYLMGSAGDPGAESSERPAHRVSLERTIAMGQLEVSVAQWQTCVAAGACGEIARVADGSDGQLPAVRVNYSDSRGYAAWLSSRTGRRYRLPTESEWEFAARAGSSGAYFWGGVSESCRHANAAPQDQAGTSGCRDRHAARAPVGSYAPNAFGLYDMAGNAREWTLDCWSDNYEGAPDDGSATDALGCLQRVTRGGSWRSSREGLRSAARQMRNSSQHDDDLGFRVVAD